MIIFPKGIEGRIVDADFRDLPEDQSGKVSVMEKNKKVSQLLAS